MNLRYPLPCGLSSVVFPHFQAQLLPPSPSPHLLDYFKTNTKASVRTFVFYGGVLEDVTITVTHIESKRDEMRAYSKGKGKGESNRSSSEEGWQPVP